MAPKMPLSQATSFFTIAHTPLVQMYIDMCVNLPAFQFTPRSNYLGVIFTHVFPPPHILDAGVAGTSRTRRWPRRKDATSSPWTCACRTCPTDPCSGEDKRLVHAAYILCVSLRLCVCFVA